MGDSGQFLSLAVPIAKVLVPIGLGLLLRLIGMFGDDEGVVLRKFVVRFTVPIFVFFSIYEAETDSIAAIGPMMLALPLLSVVLFLLGWAVASRFQGGPRRAAVHACITFCNYGWLGWGVAAALLGKEGLQRAVYFTLLWWPVFYAFGLPIGLIHTGRRGGGVSLRRTLTVALPPLAAMALGLAANLGGLRVPALVSEALMPFGRMTVPIILLSVGMMLDFSRLHHELRPALIIGVISLVVGPLVAWGLATMLARDGVTFDVIIFEGAMPVATIIPLLEENFEIDRNMVNSAIVLSTALSFVTLPIVAALVLT